MTRLMVCRTAAGIRNEQALLMQIATLLLVLAVAIYGSTCAADEQRRAEVAVRGADVMPFQLSATTHIFSKTATGGSQCVVAKNLADVAQIDLVRRHVHDIQVRFDSGDFSGPSHIHGADMPGLVVLNAANHGEIVISYRDATAGPSLRIAQELRASSRLCTSGLTLSCQTTAPMP